MSDMNQFEEILASGGIPIPCGDASANNEEAEEDVSILVEGEEEGVLILVAGEVAVPLPKPRMSPQ